MKRSTGNRRISTKRLMQESSRRNRFTIPCLLIGWICCIEPTGLLAQEPANPVRWYDGIVLNAFVSTSYSYNFNKPDTMENMYRVFDVDDNSVKLDAVELSIARKTAQPGDVGFRVDVMAGSSIPRVTKSAGMETGDLDLHQVFGTFVVPLGSGLKLDVGKFVTPLGYEVVEGYDGYNDNYSHSFLFGYAIPFTHTGLKASYQITDRLAGMVMLTNGWDNAVDNNRAKTVGVQLAIVPVDGMNLCANYLAGPEKTDNTSDGRAILDVVGTYKINPLLTVGVNFDHGMEEHSTIDGETARWEGMAGYVRLNIPGTVSLAIRSEVFHDWDGLRTGTPQTLQEITFTPEYRPADHLIVRGDIRYDKSDGDVFQKGNAWTSDQTTLGLNVLFVF
jgi:hypothetical protein